MKEFILAFFGSLCPAILVNVDRKKFLWVGLSGSVGWLVFSGVNNTYGQVVMATFAGAVAVGLFSEVMARLLKSPATVFSISGIFPLVPGIGAYNTVQLIVKNNLKDGAITGIETLASAGAIALGIMLMSATFRSFNKVRRKFEGI